MRLFVEHGGTIGIHVYWWGYATAGLLWVHFWNTPTRLSVRRTVEDAIERDRKRHGHR